MFNAGLNILNKEDKEIEITKALKDDIETTIENNNIKFNNLEEESITKILKNLIIDSNKITKQYIDKQDSILQNNIDENTEIDKNTLTRVKLLNKLFKENTNTTQILDQIDILNKKIKTMDNYLNINDNTREIIKEEVSKIYFG